MSPDVAAEFAALQARVVLNERASDNSWLLSMGFVVLTMQAGFGMLEAGACAGTVLGGESWAVDARRTRIAQWGRSCARLRRARMWAWIADAAAGFDAAPRTPPRTCWPCTTAVAGLWAWVRSGCRSVHGLALTEPTRLT